ncbi:hypothetical protein MNB_SV-6-957 [hydrothermal vent metagenome]|uniref:Uncharacterized protein n=1 Tax=hydrothermal vent metagenome TaxID=652676 RepID=A0A1W1C6D2_9ZZZZ
MKYVGKELSGDEKMLESTLKLEAFYNKHKKTIWMLLAILIAVAVVKPMFNVYKDMKLEKANSALLSLQKNPKDTKALETLKSENRPLFELYKYSQSIKEKDVKRLETLSASKNSLISDISSYHSSVLSSKSSNSKYYKEMSMIEDAYLSIKAGDVKKAKDSLELIDARSPVAPIANLLKHYTIKGK